MPIADGQTSCKVWLTSVKRRPCNYEVKTRNPLKFAGVSQTRQPVSAVSGPKFSILWVGLDEILLLNSFFATVDTCLSCEDIAQQTCAIVCRLRFFHVIFVFCIFSASRVQHISNLHSKFALRPHHVWKYGRHPISDR